MNVVRMAAMIMAASLGCAGLARAQAAIDVFTSLPAGDASPARQAQLQRLAREQAARSITVVRLKPGVLLSAPVNSGRTLNFSAAMTFESVTRQATPLEGGRVLWKGDIGASGDLPKGDATIVVDGQDATGTVTAPDGRRFKLSPLGGGDTAVIELDYAKLPKDEPEGNPRVVAPGPGASNAVPPAAMGDAMPTIDLLVAYTPSAASSAGGIDALVDLATAETNESFVASEVTARVRVVARLAVAYVEDGKTFDDVMADFVKDPAVNAARDTARADVAVLIINKADYCGLADDISATAATAFVIVHYGCATGYYSFGHEIGHIAGARHDVAHDGSTSPYPFGHGYQHASSTNGWRTIMGYSCDDGSCPTRLKYWSNPLVKYQGLPLGEAAQANNARVWNERAPVVAAFR